MEEVWWQNAAYKCWWVSCPLFWAETELPISLRRPKLLCGVLTYFVVTIPIQHMSLVSSSLLLQTHSQIQKLAFQGHTQAGQRQIKCQMFFTILFPFAQILSKANLSILWRAYFRLQNHRCIENWQICWAFLFIIGYIRNLDLEYMRC